MTNEEESGVFQEAQDSLERIQTFDPESLAQEKKLGDSLNFREAVQPAQRLVDLYNRLSNSALQDLPTSQLGTVKNQANSTYKIFSDILEFDPAQETNVHGVREDLINQVERNYEPTFQTLHPLIAYSLHRSADFQRLDQDARATFQAIQDKADEAIEDLEGAKEKADGILTEVRRVAAEAGVSQEARHFKSAADHHQTEAATWKTNTIKLAWTLGGFAILSFFIHKIPLLVPETTYDTVQIAVSKLLVFATISYMLYLAARNFLSHQHNEIVNRHRQHALMTYRTLAEAADSAPNRDVVLTYAAACIFGPQATGYTQDAGDRGGGPRNVVELLTRQFTEE